MCRSIIIIVITNFLGVPQCKELPNLSIHTLVMKHVSTGFSWVGKSRLYDGLMHLHFTRPCGVVLYVFGVCIDWSGWQCENGQLDAARAPRSSWQPLNNTPPPANAPCILKGQGKYCCRLLVTSNSILPPQHKQITLFSAFPH